MFVGFPDMWAALRVRLAAIEHFVTWQATVGRSSLGELIPTRSRSLGMHKRPLLLVILLAALLPWLLQAYRVRQLDRCRSNALEISCALEMYASDCSLSVAPAGAITRQKLTSLVGPCGVIVKSGV